MKVSNLPDHMKSYENGTVFECFRCNKKCFYTKGSMETLSAFNRRYRAFIKAHRNCKDRA
jgi:hypothetical protein